MTFIKHDGDHEHHKKKCVFKFKCCRYSHKFILKASPPPKSLMENLCGPPVWASTFISLTVTVALPTLLQ